MKKTGKTASKQTTRNIVLCALFAALIAIGAFIKIPIPYVPITFQGFFVLLAGFLLGSKYGSISMLLYLAIGLIGFPVFTQGGGLMYVMQPTFGYLIGFAVCAFMAGYFAEKIKVPTVGKLFGYGMLSMVPVYVIGTIYFYFIMNFALQTPMTLWAVLWSCVIVFLPADLLRCLLASWLAKRLLPVLRKNGTL
ncbi:MAG: biotin transporter BioY [Christensenella sp.]|nr:biotin transporter BioY [Christensenella sp.]